LIGCGYWGANLLRDLNAAGCTVDVVDPALSETPAGARRLFADLDALGDEAAGYVVATPSNTHAGIIEKLLRRRRPIFCEKPLTTDPASARATAARGKGLVFVMHKWAYHGGIEALQDIAASGELGAVKGIFTRRLQWGKPAAAADPVWELAIHDLVIVNAILGRLPSVAEARATVTVRGLEGIVAILGTAPFAHLEVSAIWPGVERKVRVFFEKGMAILDDAYADHIEIVRELPPAGERSEPKSIERRAIDTEWPSTKQIRSFVRHLQGGPPPPTNADEGAAVVAMLHAIREKALGPFTKQAAAD
jgi:predicted dehydrogenase